MSQYINKQIRIEPRDNLRIRAPVFDEIFANGELQDFAMNLNLKTIKLIRQFRFIRTTVVNYNTCGPFVVSIIEISKPTGNYRVLKTVLGEITKKSIIFKTLESSFLLVLFSFIRHSSVL